MWSSIKGHGAENLYEIEIGPGPKEPDISYILTDQFRIAFYALGFVYDRIAGRNDPIVPIPEILDTPIRRGKRISVDKTP